MAYALSYLKESKLEYNDFLKIYKRISHNDIISDYYDRLAEEADTLDDFFLLKNRSQSVSLCGKFYDYDYYRFQAVKVLKRVNSCRDKFCPQCQSLLAQTRLAKYSPILDEYSKDYDLYHVVFTVPNCSPSDLKITLTRMYKAFGHMIRYFRGNAKVKGIDFLQYGFFGAVRSLEITQNFTTGELHPHFHCIFVLKKDLNLEKDQVNSFSFSNGVFQRYFSDFEIILQKVWCLLVNGFRVSLSALDDLDTGYSVVADKAIPGDYKEIFKYALKGCCKGDKIFTYESFKALYFALHNRRIVQGYGALRCLKFESDEILEDQVDENFNAIVEELVCFEDPVFITESLTESMTEVLRGNCCYITKANIRRTLRDAEVLSSRPCLRE